MESLKTEQRAAEIMLQRGVPVNARAPFFLRIFGKKTVRLKLYMPNGGTLQRVGIYYLKTGIPAEQLNDISVEDAMILKVKHGKNIYRGVACGILNGWIAGWAFTIPFAWYLLWSMKEAEVCKLFNMLVTYGGLSDFMTTTRYLRAFRITAPRLGQATKGS